jgi:hypothetical protein
MLSDKALAKTKFDQLLIEAIDETLTSLGTPVKNMLYFQLENSFNMPKEEIPNQIDEFTEIIHKIFGLGASRLEIKFLKILILKIQVRIEVQECDLTLSDWIMKDKSFTKYVNSIRKNYCNE